ncbi:hypothetical protein [Bradyrhizobium sp. I1.7.5]|jgi:hypothetical protein|uniref:hypothetical protein n=1 Tax=Bradyrhizobium sp. I1.7.5 TaxID=3156363 RepID=UPI003399A611
MGHATQLVPAVSPIGSDGFRRFKFAYDDVMSAVYRSQANALMIEAQAERRLADEYDAAQARGEIGRPGAHISGGKMRASEVATPLELHEARAIRDAELADPGIVQRTVEAAVAEGVGLDALA